MSEDEAVGEVETDKTSVPVPSPCAGVITALLIEDGEKVVPGQVIFKVSTDASAAAEAPKAAPAAAAPKQDSPPAPAADSAPADTIDAPKEVREATCYLNSNFL